MISEYIIQVLIVDDKPKFARSFAEIVNGFTSMFNGVKYNATVIAELNTFSKAKEYILARQHEIDIVMIDYNVDEHLKGTDLFRLIDRRQYLIYKVLHSVTDDSILQTQTDLNKGYDHFCKSKGETDVIPTLSNYENEILNIKLYGNANFRDAFMVNPTRVKKQSAENTFAGVPFLNILYAKTDGKSKDEITVYYRNPGSKQIEEIARKTHSVKDFTNSGFPFKRINPSLFINLLWVAKIDVINKKIRFIGLNNEVTEINYLPTETCFNTEVLPYIDDIDKYIPHFLKS